MAEDKDFVDIQGRGNRNLKRIRFTPEDLDSIRENPSGLTKEGCLMKIKQWSLSNNQHVLFKYLAMLKNYEKFTSSGKIKAEGKDELKARLGKDGASPNLADALCLTFVQGGRYKGKIKAAPVRVKSAGGWT